MAGATPFLDRLRESVLVADGGMGSMLYARGIPLDTSYDGLNLSHRDLVRSVHEEFLAAGAALLETNTFGANRTRLAPHGLADKVRAININGARLAKRVAGRKAFVAGSVGPLGKPADGETALPVAEKEEVFREQVAALAEGGVDLFVLETFLDLEELLAAVRAARKATGLPVVASLAFVDVTGTTGGVPLLRAVRALESAGVNAVGLNCGRGFADALKVVEEMVRRTDLPVMAMPNAGLPDFVDGRFVYRATSAYMASMAVKMADLGANLLGGCCGTTPADIAAIASALRGRRPAKRAARLADPPAPKARTKRRVAVRPPGFLDAMKRGKPLVVVELDTPRGLGVKKVIEHGRRLAGAGVGLVSMAENPLASVRMGNVAMATLMKRDAAMEPLVHFTCRDRNLLGLQSDIMGAVALGIRNILAITGDPAGSGEYLGARSVFDVNSIGLVGLIDAMNRGTLKSGAPIGRPAGLTVGVAFNPNVKRIDTQVRRLEQKIEAGAHFAMSQIVFDPDKVRAMYEAVAPLDFPVLVGVMPLRSLRNAEFVANEVPGVTVPPYVIDRFRDLGPEEARREGVRIANEVVDVALECGAPGVYVVPPFNDADAALEVVSHLRARWKGRGRRG
ncbi:MAG TPA: bifunctional homocysteine S-methyltransferase/methylenetetrahydrofolate reductase [Planctomycetota bacterium]|nr:bifunctional homocysteine S-methyltransferase/methylenetetrahydrofolate reductase [Planctomycetota bacterium]